MRCEAECVGRPAQTRQQISGVTGRKITKFLSEETGGFVCVKRASILQLCHPF